MSTILTPAQTCGPLFGFALFPEGLTHTVDPAAARAVTIEGAIFDGAGESVGYGSFIEFWSDGQTCRARTLDGRFKVTVAKPKAGVVPGVGTLSPSLNIYIFTRGLARPLMTRMYFPDEAARNAVDPVMSRVPANVRGRLVAAAGTAPDRLTHDLHLQGDRESVFFDLDAQ